MLRFLQDNWWLILVVACAAIFIHALHSDEIGCARNLMIVEDYESCAAVPNCKITVEDVVKWKRAERRMKTACPN